MNNEERNIDQEIQVARDKENNEVEVAWLEFERGMLRSEYAS